MASESANTLTVMVRKSRGVSVLALSNPKYPVFGSSARRANGSRLWIESASGACSTASMPAIRQASAGGTRTKAYTTGCATLSAPNVVRTAAIAEAAFICRSQMRMAIQLENDATAERAMEAAGVADPSIAMEPSAMMEAFCTMMAMKNAASTAFSESGSRVLESTPMAISMGTAAMQVPRPLRNASKPFVRPLNPATIMAVWERASPITMGVSAIEDFRVSRRGADACMAFLPPAMRPVRSVDQYSNCRFSRPRMEPCSESF